MKRRILPMIMAVMMILSIIQVPAWAADGDILEVNGTEYSDLGQALNAIKEICAEGETASVILLADVTWPDKTQHLEIAESWTVELDLNGHYMAGTNSASFLVNRGTLTINDSSAEPGSNGIGSGRIYTTNTENQGRHAVENYGTLTINGGIFGDNDTDQTNTNNSHQRGNALRNYGTATINGGAFTACDNYVNDGYAYAIANGGDDYPNATMTINYATVYGSCNGLIASDNGTMTVEGGTYTLGKGNETNLFYMAYTSGGGQIIINNGEFSRNADNDYGFFYDDGDTDVGITVSGGIFADEREANDTKQAIKVGAGTVRISGGTFENDLTASEGASLSVTGGIFSEDVSEYLDPSCNMEQSGDNWVVTPLTAENATASVGDKYYNSLSAAIAAAEDGDTVTLLKSVEVASRIEIADDITLDLDGKTLTSTADIGILVASNTSFELTGGTLDHNPASGSTKSGVFVCASATFTLASDATIESTAAGVTGTNNAANEGNATFNIYGTIDCDDIGIWGQGPNNTYNIIGAIINSNYFGVYQNGSYGGCSVTIQDSTITDGLTNGCGVYIANSNNNAQNPTQGMQTLVIENSSITGATAVEVKYTDVTITGENTVLTATGKESVTQNGNGSVTTGYALAITHNGTGSTVDSADGDVVVTGGTFNGEVGVQSPIQSAQTAAEVAISGGTFSSEVEDEYCAPGFEPTTIDGKYTVQLKEENFSAQIQNENGQIVAAYENLSGAVNAVKSGQTIVLLADVTDALPVPSVADVTYTAVDGVTVSGGMSGTVAGNLTLDGITFTQKDVYLNGKEDATVTVKDCTFNDVIAHGNKLGVFNMVTAGNLVFTGNTITGTKDAGGSTEAVGIYTQNLTDVTISDNTIGAVSGTSINVNGNKGTTTITGNELTDWASAGGNTPGRAIRLSDSGDGNVTITGNKLVNNKETLESYIKISGVEENSVDATKNYWNGKSPDAKAGDGNPLFEVADATVDGSKITSEPYFEAATMRDPEDLSNYVPPVDPDDDHGSSSSSSSSSVRRYDIEADAGRGGDISPDGRVRVRRGENQTFRITADDGWEIADVEVDGESVGAVSRYTFENVRTDHTISATFRQTGAQTEEAQLPFLDVAEGAWYYDAVAYCYENGIMDGTSSVSFAPNMLLNRAMAAQVLYNLADGTASTAAGFPDVAASAWYADAVNWAAANGYVTGYDNGSFGPEDSLTREQLAVILYRYAGSPEPTGSLDGFTDAASASDYAVDALRWAVGEGLLTGKDGGRLDPAGTASRAELAQILARFAQM